jgi:hypothetical protein
MELTNTELRIMAKRIATAIRGDDFEVNEHTFAAYARATWPLIRETGINKLWDIYKADPTI